MKPRPTASFAMVGNFALAQPNLPSHLLLFDLLFIAVAVSAMVLSYEKLASK